MRFNFHGLLSLSFAVIAITISIVTLFKYSVLVGLIYSVFLAICSGIILRLFCAKCPSREACGHFVPGFMATKLFSKVLPGPFTAAEMISIVIILALLVGIPQYWLFKDMRLFSSYWSLLVFAGIEIRLMVCPKCKNQYCPVKSII
jgi:hypothetical protein